MERTIMAAALGVALYLLWTHGLTVDDLGKVEIILGLIFLGFAIFGLFTGKAYFGSKYKVWICYRKKEPLWFWVTIVFDILVGFVFVIMGLKR
ncbi:MAG TPA: hypothetical protein VK810_02795 [Dongiaceae bacterium]|nr:hypothetical protein [Dongiaceae bacterium]